MNNIELLSPAGDFECLKAAVQNGADSVYFGGNIFNARNSATNFDDNLLKEAIKYCKLRNVKTNLTLNTLIKNNEFEECVNFAKYAYECGIDAIIVQDLGLAKFLIKKIPDLPIHASTQMTVHNLEGVLELENLGFKRVVLSRELSIEEIEYICQNSNVEIEVFIHGALCISYSGECLASSFIGGRSGNRGKCAQPCRLPYSLSEGSEVIDNGYLLSTKDLCSLEYITRLVKSGVKCFKIEGRMKPPKYVATVTRIYRKYIDMAIKNTSFEITNEDKKDLMQVFNRGNFSTGHLDEKGNKSLIYPSKPNNMGLFLGIISNFNLNKGYISLKLNEPIEIGDTISVEGEHGTYTISEIIPANFEKSGFKNAHKNMEFKSGSTVTIGRMKGNFKKGLKIYKMSSKKLDILAESSYVNIENKKIPLVCKINLHLNEPVKISVSTIDCDESIYNNIYFEIESEIIPENALKSPISEDRIKSQLNKTTNTPYEFKEIIVNMDENLYISKISDLNNLRRQCLEKLENIILERYCNKNIKLSAPAANFSSLSTVKKYTISILLNKLNLNYNYSSLRNINKIYIPFKYFVNANYTDLLKDLSNKFEIYIYLPTIIRKYYQNLINSNLEKVLLSFKIIGLVVSNLGNLDLLKNIDSSYELIGNYTLNVFNNFSASELVNLGLNKITISPELNETDFENFAKNCNQELIVYGKIPIMNINYCPLSKCNKCLKDCKKSCMKNKNYYLIDRLGFKFEIIPDFGDCTTTIYNSKILSIDPPKSANNLRLDFIHETIDEINSIVLSVLDGKKVEGSDFTNGNWHRDV